MQAPLWWEKRGIISDMLLPLAALYARAGERRRHYATPIRPGVPIICVGNLVAGGAGKTPVALAIASLALELEWKPHFLTRGYGGRLTGPILVDPAAHDCRDVGDEALLLARMAPTWVSRDRPLGAAAAVQNGAGLIIMDDGLQNPSLRQDLAVLVIDGTYGFGNGRVIPAGPLRETFDAARARLHAAIIIGTDRHQLAKVLTPLPTALARFSPVDAELFCGQRVLPFAGIGRPQKFFQTLLELGAEICESARFADHHPYTASDIQRLRERAKSLSAQLVTTEKDWVRIPLMERDGIEVLPVRLVWDDATRALIGQLIASLSAPRH